MKQLNKYKSILTDFFFYLSILFFIIGFNFSDNMVIGWYQQFMPNLNGKQITDITFLDSLKGYAVATQTADSSYILKTTNGGDNWQIIHRQLFAMTQIQFLDLNTGYAGGGYLYKTTNGGFNWNQLNTPATTVEKIYIINQDTIFFVNSESLTGGVFLTTNGGSSWVRQLDLGSQNPSKIYMFNGRIGFVSSTAGLYKTTNSGLNWLNISNDFSFSDMFFIDSLIGWKASGFIKKTTDGGLTWINQNLPNGGNILASQITRLSKINNDTIWGVGGIINTSLGLRGMIYRTINGGNNWLFQMPDTVTINISEYWYISFYNKTNGWAYPNFNRGVHTVTGGDLIFYTSIEPSKNIPNTYNLEQNFPNPFNPTTTIKFLVNKSSDIKIIVYDIQGRKINELLNKKLSPGKYETVFDGTKYSSGIYFYSMLADGVLIDTKKMILIK